MDLSGALHSHLIPPLLQLLHLFLFLDHMKDVGIPSSTFISSTTETTAQLVVGQEYRLI